jgi:hypothetical protein
MLFSVKTYLRLNGATLSCGQQVTSSSYVATASACGLCSLPVRPVPCLVIAVGTNGHLLGPPWQQVSFLPFSHPLALPCNVPLHLFNGAVHGLRTLLILVGMMKSTGSSAAEAIEVYPRQPVLVVWVRVLHFHPPEGFILPSVQGERQRQLHPDVPAATCAGSRCGTR